MAEEVAGEITEVGVRVRKFNCRTHFYCEHHGCEMGAKRSTHGRKLEARRSTSEILFYVHCMRHAVDVLAIELNQL